MLRHLAKPITAFSLSLLALLTLSAPPALATLDETLTPMPADVPALVTIRLDADAWQALPEGLKARLIELDAPALIRSQLSNLDDKLREWPQQMMLNPFLSLDTAMYDVGVSDAAYGQLYPERVEQVLAALNQQGMTDSLQKLSNPVTGQRGAERVLANYSSFRGTADQAGMYFYEPIGPVIKTPDGPRYSSYAFYAYCPDGTLLKKIADQAPVTVRRALPAAVGYSQGELQGLIAQGPDLLASLRVFAQDKNLQSILSQTALGSHLSLAYRSEPGERSALLLSLNLASEAAAQQLYAQLKPLAHTESQGVLTLHQPDAGRYHTLTLTIVGKNLVGVLAQSSAPFKRLRSQPARTPAGLAAQTGFAATRSALEHQAVWAYLNPPRLLTATGSQAAELIQRRLGTAMGMGFEQQPGKWSLRSYQAPGLDQPESPLALNTLLQSLPGQPALLLGGRLSEQPADEPQVLLPRLNDIELERPLRLIQHWLAPDSRAKLNLHLDGNYALGVFPDAVASGTPGAVVYLGIKSGHEADIDQLLPALDFDPEGFETFGQSAGVWRSRLEPMAPVRLESSTDTPVYGWPLRDYLEQVYRVYQQPLTENDQPALHPRLHDVISLMQPLLQRQSDPITEQTLAQLRQLRQVVHQLGQLKGGFPKDAAMLKQLAEAESLWPELKNPLTGQPALSGGFDEMRQDYRTASKAGQIYYLARDSQGLNPELYPSYTLYAFGADGRLYSLAPNREEFSAEFVLMRDLPRPEQVTAYQEPPLRRLTPAFARQGQQLVLASDADTLKAALASRRPAFDQRFVNAPGVQTEGLVYLDPAQALGLFRLRFGSDPELKSLLDILNVGTTAWKGLRAQIRRLPDGSREQLLQLELDWTQVDQAINRGQTVLIELAEQEAASVNLEILRNNQNLLRLMVERYAIDHQGHYPRDLKDLIEAANHSQDPYWRDLSNPYTEGPPAISDYAAYQSSRTHADFAGQVLYEPLRAADGISSYRIYAVDAEGLLLQENGQPETLGP